jgi:hypothetical protein
MALRPTIKACSKNGCSRITVTDTTGAYHVTLNPSGWGAPNIDADDTGFIATIAITTGGTTTTVDVTDQVPSIVSGSFIFDDIDVPLTDGWVTIVYTVSTDAVAPVSITKKIFVYCVIKCCVFSKMASMKDLDPCKDSAELLKYLHMWNLYKTMIFEANGCNANEASNTLTRLQKLCNIDADCGCS